MERRMLFATALASGVIWTLSAQTSAQVFMPAATYATDLFPEDLAAADFDNDGLTDIALTHSLNKKTVSVLLSNGNGFGAPTEYAIPPSIGSGHPTQPVYLCPTDWDSDGLADLAYSARYGAGGVTYQQTGILYNGAGVFAAGPVSATGDDVAGLAAADFNRDGRPDLALATRPSQSSSSGTVSIHYQQPGGALAREFHSVGDSTYGIANGDFDGNGYVDLGLATSDFYHKGQPVRLLYGGPTGFASVTYVAGPAHVLDLSAFDLNGDGLADIAMGGYTGVDVLTILYSLGASGFTRVDIPATGRPYGMVSADFNGDGRADLAMSLAIERITVLYGQVGGGLGAPEHLVAADGWCRLVTGDFDGNGAIDLAALNHDVASFSVFYNTTPEPATLSLLALGGLGLVLQRRRKK